MKVTEQYFPVVLFVMQSQVVLTFESVDSCSAVLSFVADCLPFSILQKVICNESFSSHGLRLDTFGRERIREAKRHSLHLFGH